MKDLNSYNVLSYDELLAKYRLLAGRANKRMERLEKAGRTVGSAYRSAARSAASMRAASGSSGRKDRFPTSRPADLRELRARINAVQNFLSDQTSTPAGLRKVDATIGVTLKQKYGLRLDPEQIKATFEGALWNKLNNRFGSATAVQIIASLQRTKGNVQWMLNDLSERNVYLSGKERMSLAATISNYRRANKINYLFPDNRK